MKNKKLVEILSLTVFVFLALQFIILPGLASDNELVNLIALTAFFLLVVFVLLGGAISGINRDSE